MCCMAAQCNEQVGVGAGWQLLLQLPRIVLTLGKLQR